MIGELSYVRNGETLKTEIDLDRFGIIVSGMQSINEYTEKYKKRFENLLIRQKDLMSGASMQEYPALILDSEWYKVETHPLYNILKSFSKINYGNVNVHTPKYIYKDFPEFLKKYNLSTVLVSGLEYYVLKSIIGIANNLLNCNVISCGKLIYANTREQREDITADLNENTFYVEKYSDLLPFLEQKTIIR